MLVFLRFTASYSIFYATVSLILVNLTYLLIKNSFSKEALKIWFNQTIVGFEKGALNMVGVGIAIATANNSWRRWVNGIKYKFNNSYRVYCQR